MPFFEVIPALDSGTAAAQDGITRKRWVYRQGTMKNPGDAVCQSYGSFPDEAACRSDIARQKRLMKAAGFAKVE